MATTNTFNTQQSATTILALKNQMAAALGIGFEVDKNTTINTKRNVFPNEDPPKFPKIRYFGIGIKGFANLTSENNISQPWTPSAEDGDLYEPIPFRCVAKTPLPEDEAANYRIRTIIEKDGVKYYCYWLKLIEWESNAVKSTKIVNKVESEYTFNSANLNPVPTDLKNVDLASTDNRVVVSATGICRITGAEVLEAINVLYGGDLRRARISEIGTYSGCERPFKDGDLPGFPAGTEAVYTQLCTHRCMLGHALDTATASWEPRVCYENGSCIII